MVHGPYYFVCSNFSFHPFIWMSLSATQCVRANVSLSLVTHRSPCLQLKPASIRPKVFSIVNEMLFVWIVDRITCRSSNSSRTTKCLIFISFHFPRMKKHSTQTPWLPQIKWQMCTQFVSNLHIRLIFSLHTHTHTVYIPYSGLDEFLYGI